MLIFQESIFFNLLPEACICCYWPLSHVRLFWLHELQHFSFHRPLLFPGVCSNSCPLSQWCYLSISSFATHFSFCLHYFPASSSFPKSGLFSSSGRSIGASALASVLPMNIQGWFLLGLTDLIPFQCIPADVSLKLNWRTEWCFMFSR